MKILDELKSNKYVKWTIRVIFAIGYIYHMFIHPILKVEQSFGDYAVENEVSNSFTGVVIACVLAFGVYKGVNFVLNFIDNVTFTKIVKGFLFPILPLILLYFLANICHEHIDMVQTVIIQMIGTIVIATIINPFPTIVQERKIAKLKKELEK